MRTITPKVNQTVRYRLADGRWQPGQISSVVAGTVVNIRLASGGTAAAVPLGNVLLPNLVSIWWPG